VRGSDQLERIIRPRKDWRHAPGSETEKNEEEYDISVTSDDPFDTKVAAIKASLRDRMRFYKLRVTPNATRIASTFNEQFKPEIIAEYNDPYRVEWLDHTCNDDVLVGDQALRLANPFEAEYTAKWPIYGNNFNTRDYPSLQVTLSDLEALLRRTLKDHLDIKAQDYKVAGLSYLMIVTAITT